MPSTMPGPERKNSEQDTWGSILTLSGYRESIKKEDPGSKRWLSG